jgi:hypothetical protein
MNNDMVDQRWTIPVARWSSWPDAATAATLDIAFVEPIIRRRLSSLSKMAIKVAHDCAAEYGEVRVVFASRHGELRRTTDILDDLAADQPVSPTAFSLSVLNAMTGIFGIACDNGAPATAISAGAEALGYALLEAYAQHCADLATPVLVVYADEPADARYGVIRHEVTGGALALLIDAGAGAQLECTTSATAGACASGSFPTQSEALLHGLTARTSAAWQGLGRRWQWTFRDGGAA